MTGLGTVCQNHPRGARLGAARYPLGIPVCGTGVLCCPRGGWRGPPLGRQPRWGLMALAHSLQQGGCQRRQRCAPWDGGKDSLRAGGTQLRSRPAAPTQVGDPSGAPPSGFSRWCQRRRCGWRPWRNCRHGVRPNPGCSWACSSGLHTPAAISGWTQSRPLPPQIHRTPPPYPRRPCRACQRCRKLAGKRMDAASSA